MDVAIRELEAAELAAVSGGQLRSDLGKIGWALTGGLIGGAIGGATAAAFYVISDALLNYVSKCGQCGGEMGQPM